MNFLENILSFFGILDYVKRFIQWIKNKIRPIKQEIKEKVTTELPDSKNISINIIESPHAKVQIIVRPKEEEEAKKLHDTENGYFVLAEQVEDYVKGIEPEGNYANIYAKLKKLISLRDLAILTSSFVILKTEPTDGKKARTLRNAMVKQFGDRSKRIFNNLRDGSFERVLMPFFNDLENLKPNNLKSIFSDFYETFLNKATDRIWFRGYEKIEDEIKNKLKVSENLTIRVSGVERLSKVDKVCRNFVSSNKGYYLKIVESKFLDEPERIFVISKL